MTAISLKGQIKKELAAICEQVFPEINIQDLNIKIEYPPRLDMGDYAAPLAMENAKIFKQNPKITAQNIINAWKVQSNKEIISDIQIAGPGFLNIFVSDHFLSSRAYELSMDENFGKDILLAQTNAGQEDTIAQGREKILVEYVSANPTGPLNVVSARAASLGSSLVNIFRHCGLTVHGEFYVNDFGNQVNLLAKSVAARFLQKLTVDIDFPADGYHGDYVNDIAQYCSQNFEKQLGQKDWGKEDIEYLADLFKEAALEYNISQQKKDLADFGVVFDNWYSERSLHEQDKPMQVLGSLMDKNVIYEQEGKKVFRSTDFGDDKDRVVQRDDGRPTYFMADIAYHLDKLERGYKHLINIWGPDHHGYIARLRGAVEALGFNRDTLEILIAQQVNLLESGEVVKMSKRAGAFTTLRELLEEIPLDAVRFFFIMRAADSRLDFDLELAQKKTMDNPVYYIQYAHARICSVLKENEKNEAFEIMCPPESLWQEKSRRNLLLYLLRFPDELIEIAQSREVHRMTVYLHELASHFQRLYQQKENRVKGGDPSVGPAILTLMIATRNVLRQGLSLISVSAPESM